MDSRKSYVQGRSFRNCNNSLFQRLVNQDGLVYADLDFPVRSGPAVIHGLEDRTTYATVDLTKKAEPLPDDFDDEKET